MQNRLLRLQLDAYKPDSFHLLEFPFGSSILDLKLTQSYLLLAAVILDTSLYLMDSKKHMPKVIRDEAAGKRWFLDQSALKSWP